MRKELQGIIFDLDGTLIESREDLVLSVNHALSTLGRPILPADRISGYVGDGVKDLLHRCLPDAGEDFVNRAVSEFKTHYAEHLLDNTRLYPGVLETLNIFKGKRMAVISNKPENFTLRILEGLGVRSYFDGVLGGDSLPVKKPRPEPIWEILKRWKLSAAQVLMVGDSPNDLRAGRAAGAWTCAVTYGFRSREELRKCSPDWTINNIGQLSQKVC